MLYGKELVKEAEYLARRHHLSQVYDGKDYVDTHVAEVVRRVAADPSATDVHVAAAWLHDTMEDTEIYPSVIYQIGGVELLMAVGFLTKVEGESYEEYMTELVTNPIATLVKYHDSAANYAYGQRPKYKKNMDFLWDFIPEASREYLKNSS